MMYAGAVNPIDMCEEILASDKSFKTKKLICEYALLIEHGGNNALTFKQRQMLETIYNEVIAKQEKEIGALGDIY